MTRAGLSSAWDFAQRSVLMHWLVLPLTALATLTFLLGLVILPAAVVVELVVYYLLVASAVMLVGLGAEWLLRRLLESDEERAYH
ncbi:hypothetical protein [Haloarchaeobius iranensis]|uniref:Uncharacterized protein n=1 Tax=Haloarchaeobius iranensis TaxID=996166 RepID=A0A1H0ABP8_9EURY|nr:hypothetical protein [Haloarchaeobius iranensis]SDN30734.1 hypothetical protein SAMN05192554_1267 [Haloarchaeobius iranensis]